MDSEDFFIIKSGVFRDADEAFEQAAKKEDGSTTALAEKENCVVLEVPKGKDPLAFAKERSARHGADFWNFVDGPAACVEIKGDWLKANKPKDVNKTKGFKMFVFFGQTYSTAG